LAKNKDNNLSRMDALSCIPAKNSLVKEERLDSGDLILACPQAYRPFFRRMRRMLGQSSDTFIRKIQLDQLGCDVWAMIDGKKDVRSIIQQFATLHRIHIREAEISVPLFVKSLGEKGMIGLKQPS